jgi:hypothetical protein
MPPSQRKQKPARPLRIMMPLRRRIHVIPHVPAKHHHFILIPYPQPNPARDRQPRISLHLHPEMIRGRQIPSTLLMPIRRVRQKIQNLPPRRIRQPRRFLNRQRMIAGRQNPIHPPLRRGQQLQLVVHHRPRIEKIKRARKPQKRNAIAQAEWHHPNSINGTINPASRREERRALACPPFPPPLVLRGRAGVGVFGEFRGPCAYPRNSQLPNPAIYVGDC